MGSALCKEFSRTQTNSALVSVFNLSLVISGKSVIFCNSASLRGRVEHDSRKQGGGSGWEGIGKSLDTPQHH